MGGAYAAAASAHDVGIYAHLEVLIEKYRREGGMGGGSLYLGLAGCDGGGSCQVGLLFLLATLCCSLLLSAAPFCPCCCEPYDILLPFTTTSLIYSVYIWGMFKQTIMI